MTNEHKENTMTSFNPLSIFIDARRVTRGTPELLAARQQQRLNELVAFARKNSRFYAEKYRSLPDEIIDVRQLPPVTKVELMEHSTMWSLIHLFAKRMFAGISAISAILANHIWASTWYGRPPALPARPASSWKTRTGMLSSP